jgi:hypothetical protein
VRAAQLADETPHRLALGGCREVELISLGRWPKLSVLPCRLIVGFQLSTEASSRPLVRRTRIVQRRCSACVNRS